MNGILNKRKAANVLGIVAIAVAVAGCNSDAASTLAPLVRAVGSIPHDRPTDEQPVLRSQMDAAGGRQWVLTAEGVEIYEVRTRQKLAQIALPGWLWVREQYSCPPALAIGPGGEAVISSNVVPTLWRIDPVTLAVSRHELAVEDEKGRDVGFTGLTYSAQQRAYFAVSGTHGAMWRIDPQLISAHSIPLSSPLTTACSLSLPARELNKRAGGIVGFCVRGDEGEWTVNLAPDQRSGYARAGQCAA
jgi:hypothetical protein